MARPIRTLDGHPLHATAIDAEGIFVALVDRLLGPVGLPWAWEKYRPFDRPAKQ